MGSVIEKGANAVSQTVYPKPKPRPVAPEVPDPYASDFSEACLVLPHSPKASAALSRRCLQHLIREEAGITEGTLNDEIVALLATDKLPTHVADNVDAVRTVGNLSAHPIKSTNTGAIIDVEPDEAEWLLDVLEDLFDFYFVGPERAKAKRAKLNNKLAEAGKPPLKSTPSPAASPVPGGPMTPK